MEARGKHVVLSDLVGKNSNYFFDVLKFDRGFLKLNPSEWENDVGFLKMRSHVTNMMICNDAAERGW